MGKWTWLCASRSAPLKSGLRLQRCSDKSKRYEWQDKKLQKKIDDDIETAVSVRAYYDRLSTPAKNIAKADLERGRVDYVAFLKTLKAGDAALSTVMESVGKIDEVLDGIYRDALKNTAPGTPRRRLPSMLPEPLLRRSMPAPMQPRRRKRQLSTGQLLLLPR